MNTFRMNIFVAFSLALLLSVWSLSAATALPAFAEDRDDLASNQDLGNHFSSNWSGYSIVGDDFSQVQGSWTIPAITATNLPLTANAEWIGIGGVTSDDLIQVGTEAFAEDDGSIFYQAFYETLPQVAVQLPMKIHAGDSMSASIEEQSDGIWAITLKNNTTGSIFNKTVAYNSNGTSADWIEEMPLNAKTGKLIPLNDFGSTTFTGVSAIENSERVNLKSAGTESITMTNRRNILAYPTNPSEDGMIFSVAQTNQLKQTTPVSIPTVQLSGNWKIIRIFYLR